jgi:hypothetical protein
MDSGSDQIVCRAQQKNGYFMAEYRKEGLFHRAGGAMRLKDLRALWWSIMVSAMVTPVFSAWNTPEVMNPVVPGYLADPFMVYDSATATFYLYATTDGVWISHSDQPHVVYTKDFVHWKYKALSLPSFWPDTSIWAPSMVRNPKNGKYYLMYTILNGAYIAYSSSPLGPWTNAVSGNTPLYAKGQLSGTSDYIDPQFFTDTNTIYFTFGQSGQMGVARLAFDSTTFLASIDNTDARMTNGTTYKYKLLSGLTNALEGSCMFRKDSLYYITYSNSACENYNVQYAVAHSPVGPFTYINERIVTKDSANGILGPGGNSIVHYGNNWYICYHRQHFQYVDVKRQTCLDQITFKGDTISANSETTAGISAKTGAIESLYVQARAVAETNLAYGKPTLASSQSGYKGGTSGNQKILYPAIANFYKSSYAVDENNGTCWAPDTTPGWLIVDLGGDMEIGRCETTFEYMFQTYKYQIQYLRASEAADTGAARISTAWHMYADRSANADSVSPEIDSNAVTARYMRITLLSANLPTVAGQISTIIQTDYANRLGIWEFRVFAPTATQVLPQNRSSDGTARSGGGLSYLVKTPGLVSIRLVNAAGRTAYRCSVDAAAGTYVLNPGKYPLARGMYLLMVTVPGATEQCIGRFVK